MKSIDDGYGYNQRLFESGRLRGFLHRARFEWLRSRMRRHCATLPAKRVLELGCFDGKALDYLPGGLPEHYLGLDANWEDGLGLARRRWAHERQLVFRESASLQQLDLGDGAPFDVAISMETLEHLPPGDLPAYLDRIADRLDGLFFVTVPNEKGPLFLAKWLTKRVLSSDGERYTAGEVVNATLGRMHRVRRDQHKGFDWSALVVEMRRRFDVLEVSGHPLGALPPSLCFSVGIVARTRGNRQPDADH